MRIPLKMVCRRLSNDNSKLGPDVYSFSLPAGETCPGETHVCGSVCYACMGYYLQANVRRKYEDNFERARLEPDALALELLAEIRGRKIRTVRIHASGDFFSLRYIEVWDTVVRYSPDVQFFAYTRSWRLNSLRRALFQMATDRGNFKLWLSSDRESEVVGVGPIPDGVGIAYLMAESWDGPSEDLRRSDVVFRVKSQRRDVAKRVALALVCPLENGQQTQAVRALTCGTCRHCID